MPHREIAMQKNSPDLWDTYWTNAAPSAQEDLYLLRKESLSVRWRRIAARIARVFPRLDGLDMIEIGAGAGTYAALMAQQGARVTLLDYSDVALERGREFFERVGLEATFIKADALALPDDLRERYDISMSFGLNEHFQDKRRQAITRAHFDVLKPGGLTFISVPNALCPPYRLFKAVAQRAGKWSFGEEYPFTRWELLRLGRVMPCTDQAVLADSLYAAFDFINPFKASALVRRVLRLKDDHDPARLRPQHGTVLDAYLSYALVWTARKR